ncbi:hypothetical protein CTI12_AA567090 [Artemisia annua]|uniref:Uncharacterized protein n=1 Tax=Artemisia annua TaxID=35608 RepID=A0A2U1KTV9_ARTAN|nr:hypothetical protein CTI12_AA567090 [Artemisia annua]
MRNAMEHEVNKQLNEVFPTLSEANKQLNVTSDGMNEPSLMDNKDQSDEVNNVRTDANVNNKNEAKVWNNKKNWNDLTEEFEKKLSLIPTAIEDGKPIMMDRTTARMCHMGTGNIGYARVLVEIKAEKELKDKIEIVYKGKDLGTSWTKFVNVEYTWKPPRCDHCQVFGHCDSNCSIMKGKNTECDGNNGSGKGNLENSKGVNVSEEVTRMNRNKKDNAGMGNKKGPVQNRGQQDDRMADKGTVEELRKSANKYAVFCDIGDTEVLEEQVLSDKEIVEKYVKNHRQPGLEEEARWTPQMYLYFKEQWELRSNNEANEVEDVYVVLNGTAKCMVANEVEGVANGMLDKGSTVLDSSQ